MSTRWEDDAARVGVCRGRTLWLVGDSHMVDLFRALACAAGSFWDYNFKGVFPMAAEKVALDAMAEHVAHSTGPECLPLLEGTLVCLMRVNHGEVSTCAMRPVILVSPGPRTPVKKKSGIWRALFAKGQRQRTWCLLYLGGTQE